MQGTVKWFNPVKRFGFIQHENIDFFVHYKDLENCSELRDGQKVSFNPSEGKKGKIATNVKIIT